MDPLPGVMILVPILAPISAHLGIDPTHFAMIVIINLTIGLITPPWVSCSPPSRPCGSGH